jgi:hypothetical protein
MENTISGQAAERFQKSSNRRAGSGVDDPACYRPPRRAVFRLRRGFVARVSRAIICIIDLGGGERVGDITSVRRFVITRPAIGSRPASRLRRFLLIAPAS